MGVRKFPYRVLGGHLGKFSFKLHHLSMDMSSFSKQVQVSCNWLIYPNLNKLSRELFHLQLGYTTTTISLYHQGYKKKL